MAGLNTPLPRTGRSWSRIILTAITWLICTPARCRCTITGAASPDSLVRHFHFWEPLSPEYAADVEKNASSPLVIPVDQAGAWVPMLFPGIGLAENEDSWSVFHLTPLAPDRTSIVVRTKLADVSMLAFASQSIRSFNFWSKRVRGKYKSDGRRRSDGIRRLHAGGYLRVRTAAAVAQEPVFRARAFVQRGRGRRAAAPGAGETVGGRGHLVRGR